MGFFNNLNEKLQNFMVGRNGADRLTRWALGAAIVLMALNLFFNNIVILALSYACLFYSFFRIFSKDTSSRSSEDERFSGLLDKASFWKKGNKGSKGSSSGSTGAKDVFRSGSGGNAKSGDGKAKSAQDGSFRSRYGTGVDDGKQADSKMKISCEACGQSLSVPKGRGTLKVTCPKCHHQMKVKS